MSENAKKDGSVYVPQQQPMMKCAALAATTHTGLEGQFNAFTSTNPEVRVDHTHLTKAANKWYLHVFYYGK